jgi:hypothetical protein
VASLVLVSAALRKPKFRSLPNVQVQKTAVWCREIEVEIENHDNPSQLKNSQIQRNHRDDPS